MATQRHPPIHAHIHTPTAASAMQGDNQPVSSSYGKVPCSRTPRHSARRCRGFELAITSQRSLPPALLPPLSKSNESQKTKHSRVQSDLSSVGWPALAGQSGVDEAPGRGHLPGDVVVVRVLRWLLLLLRPGELLHVQHPEESQSQSPVDDLHNAACEWYNTGESGVVLLVSQVRDSYLKSDGRQA